MLLKMFVFDESPDYLSQIDDIVFFELAKKRVRK